MRERNPSRAVAGTVADADADADAVAVAGAGAGAKPTFRYDVG